MTAPKDDDRGVIRQRARRLGLQVEPGGVGIKLRRVVVALFLGRPLDDDRRVLAQLMILSLRKRWCGTSESKKSGESEGAHGVSPCDE